MKPLYLDEESFNKSISSTIKSISNKKNLYFYYKKDSTNIDGNKIYLPEITTIKNKEDLRNFRGIADFIALKLKFHNEKIHNYFKPKEKIFLELYEALEETRIMSLGATSLKGISSNLKTRLNNFCKTNQFEKIKKRKNAQITQVVKLFSIEYFLEEDLPKPAINLLNLWKPIIFLKILENLDNLKNSIHNQKLFAIESINLIKKLKKFIDKNLSPNKKESTLKKNENKKNKYENIDKEKNKENLFLSTTETKNNLFKKNNEKKIPDISDNAKFKKKSNLKLNNIVEEIKKLKYKIYTKKFDEIVKAEKFCKKNNLIKLNRQLESESNDIDKTIIKLARKLQNKLLAKNYGLWKFEEEEGFLNNSKLSKIITNINFKKIYKNYEEKKIKDTIVTLLIDNSGSMRGRPINTAAISAKIIAHTLEKCSVKVEILGFTTKEWKGGKSREQWLKNNMPSNPGRLNDLMHIVYKTPEDLIKKIKNNFALMLKDGLLKENIDGESLLWAFQRIVKRNEERKILMVISDGAPVDDSTISSNSSNYLEKHLKKVIDMIQNESNVEIIAIGIGHDVSKYYKKAVTIHDPDQLGGVMVEKFSELFKIKK